VLDLIVAGESSKRVASQLGLSLKTVEFHRANIMRNLNAASLADLVRKVIGGTPH
jgi:FixJ family two-component response regulator